jgi:hypothetical protein
MLKTATHPACFDQYRFSIPNSPQTYRPQVIVRPHTPTPFVIWTSQYDGADILVSELRHHQRIRCEGEALHATGVFAEPPLDWPLEAREAHRYNFIDRLFNESTWSQHLREFDPPTNRRDDSAPPFATGFKAAIHQTTRSEFVGITASPTIKKILLRRRNFIDMFMEQVRQMGIIDKYTSAALHLDVEALLKYLKMVTAGTQCLDFARRYAAERGFPDAWMIVPYESLVDRATSADTIRKVLRHILPESEVDAWQIHALPLEQLAYLDRLPKNQTISNYQEVRDAVKFERRYLWMLEGDT